MVKRIHVDTDIGGDTDDLCALAMLLGWPDVELAGVTTSTEANGLRAGFVRHALRLAGRDEVPVAAGASGSLAGFHEVPGIPDVERYWREPIAPLPGPPGAALDLLAGSIRGGATVIAIGPSTNLALLEAMQPGLLASTEVVLMGGYLGVAGAGLPAWGAEMDWNVQADTLAARIVFERCNPLVIPFAVTLQVALRAVHLPALRTSGPLGRLLALQAEQYARDNDHQGLARRYSGVPDDLLNFQHDALACAVAAGWDGVTIETMPLLPGLHDRWLTFTVAGLGKPTRVVTGVDSERFCEEWLKAVARAGRPDGE